MLEYSKQSASTDLGSEMISNGSNGVSFVFDINNSISYNWLIGEPGDINMILTFDASSS